MPPTGFFCTGGVPRFAVDPSRSTRLVERLRAHTNEDACRPVDKKRVGVAIVVYQAGLEASGRETEAATHIWMKVLSTWHGNFCACR